MNLHHIARAVSPVFLAFLLAAMAGTAAAQPANDLIANAEVITTLPFSDLETGIGTATTAAGDPVLKCRVPRATGGNTVWYRHTTGATTEYVTLTTATSNYDTILSIYTGTADNLKPIAGGCNNQGVPGSATLAQLAGVRLAPNTTHFIEVAQQTASATARTLSLQVTASIQYTVTKVVDTADGNCSPSDCSIREAIGASNASPGAVIIPAGIYSLGIQGASDDQNATGDLDVRQGMGIYGAGRSQTVIDGGDIDRLVDINPGNLQAMTVQISDLSIVNGLGSSFSPGGGIYANGSSSVLSLNRVSLRENATSTQGGAVATGMMTYVDDCDFRNNQNSAFGGGIYFFSNVISEVRNSLFAGNRGGNGGAIGSAGELVVVNTTITGNTAGANGGGIHYHQDVNTLRLFNTTITQNAADASSQGGGIFIQDSGNLPQLFNSVLANNTAANGFTNCNFATATGTFNHVTSNECFNGGTGNIRNTPATFLPLTNLGGTADIRAFDAGSPLLDAGNPSGCFDENGQILANDQRGPGFPRALDGNADGSALCDKGAYEFAPPSPNIFANGFE
ncbi:MAG: CSLREA domain-containing protein [Ahniella sp.]|nr:CSLREA domain-containing protein [Ahniella sp.]